MVNEVPERIIIGRRWVAVGQDHGRAGQQAAYHQVPDNPARAAQEHEAIAGQHIVLQAIGLEVGEHDAAMTVHHGLGQAGGSRRVHHPQRMGERHALELQRRCMARCIGPAHAVTPGHGRMFGIAAEQGPRHMNHLGNIGQSPEHLVQHFTAIELPAGIAIAVGRENQLGRNLLEAIQHHGYAHLRRAAGPDGANAGTGQKRHHRLGHIGQVGHDAIAAAQAEFAHPGRERRHVTLQLPP
ncbi:hypothetical protein SDC9_144634 [bioreactor metagenome]|uniref:Uncharacterized protein n=1 Tax=bioreactor metagenome TaxID=1076179 RepID=A0A645E7I5_9ZZZZ